MRVDLKFSPITVTLENTNDVTWLQNALWYYIKNHRTNPLFSKESQCILTLESLLKELENKHGK